MKTPVNRPMTCLGVFAKHWTPGTVKTRLAVALGEPLAAEIYYELLATTLTRFAGMADRCIIAYTPDEHSKAFAQLAPGWNVAPQSAGDLGRRLATFFQEQLAAGCPKVVVVGADSPHLPLEYVAAAFSALDSRDVVLGPTDDGGYYLVGLKDAAPPIFHDIPWGTAAVWRETIARLEHANPSPAVLPAWYDVDRPSDLERLATDLTRLAAADTTLEHLAARLRTLLR